MELNQNVVRWTPCMLFHKIVSNGRKKKDRGCELEKPESSKVQSQVKKIYVGVRLQSTREVGRGKEHSPMISQIPPFHPLRALPRGSWDPQRSISHQV